MSYQATVGGYQFGAVTRRYSDPVRAERFLVNIAREMDVTYNRGAAFLVSSGIYSSASQILNGITFHLERVL